MKSIVTAILMLLGSTPCLAENIALGRPYTLSHPPNYPYCTDDGDSTDLTDGVRYDPKGTSLWTQKSTVGWAIGDQLKFIEIDLGEICSVNGVTFETAADARSQGTFPLAVLVFLSDDGKTYSYAGNIINESVSQASYVVHTFELTDLNAQGRYIRIQTISGGYYVFVDEIEVAGSKPGNLQPRVRELDATGVDKFSQQRVPITRQINSSLSLLAHAESQLEKQPAEYAEAAERAKQKLKSIRSEVLNRESSEEVDFRRGVPFTKLDVKTCSVMGDYLATTGDPSVRLATTHPWAPLMPFDWEPVQIDDGPILLMKNEWGELAFNLTNATTKHTQVKVNVTGVPAKVVSAFEVKYVEAFGFRLRADALMPLNDALELPPGMTKQVWLSIDTRDVTAGDYKGTLSASAGGNVISQPFEFTVVPVTMPQRPSLNINPFSYMHWPIAKTDPTGVTRNLREHYVDTQVVVSSYLPNYRADADGNFIQPMDFTALDEYMDLLPDTRLWILFLGFEWDNRKMYPRADEPRREKIFRQWTTGVIQHLKQRGLTYGQFAFLWHDEPSREAMRTIIKPSTDLLRRIDPKAQVWIDISSDNTPESIAEFADAADIWCPASEKLDWDVWKDKRTWFYDSASDKSRSPTGHYRHKLWLAFDRGCTGNAFWTYTDSSNLWDDYATSPTYSVVYDGPDGVISSKRWDAYRAGIEDYELCRMMAERAKDNPALAHTLRQWVMKVLSERNDPSVADRAHRELLRHLATN